MDAYYIDAPSYWRTSLRVISDKLRPISRSTHTHTTRLVIRVRTREEDRKPPTALHNAAASWGYTAAMGMITF